MIGTSVPGIKLSTDQQSNPAMHHWFAEVLLLGEYWRTTGLLERLQTQVKVHRRRMGHYEVCDFVLMLLAYAVSGLDTPEGSRSGANEVRRQRLKPAPQEPLSTQSFQRAPPDLASSSSYNRDYIEAQQ